MKEIIVKAAFDQREMGSVPLVGWQEIDQFLNKAHSLVENRAQLPIPERISILEKTIKVIDGQFDAILNTAAEEGGKPYLDSKVEVSRALQGIAASIEELKSMRGHEVPMRITASSAQRLAFTTREPVGIVAALSAFNHPFNLIVHQVIPAVATGCPVIIKPAKSTPLSCQNLLQALYQAGLPKEWAQWGLCDHDVAEKLVSDPRLAYFSFIGSAAVGWKLRSKLAPGVTCALEHGGAAPVIVEADADLKEALPLLAKGGFYHAGQVCVSVQRIYIQEKILPLVADQLTVLAKKLKVGDPLDPATEVGPLISASEVDRVHTWVHEAVKAGGKILCGGKKITATTYEPTIVLDPPDHVTLSQKEVFGPVVVLYSYRDRAEAIKRANALPLFFQAAVFTKNIDVALDTVKRLNAVAVMINDHTAFRVDWMPFAGRKESGMGVGGIPYSMHEMTYEKMMVIKSSVL